MSGEGDVGANVQQGSDALCDDGGSSGPVLSWEEVFGTSSASMSVPIGISTEVGTDPLESGTELVCSMAVGTESGVEAGVQAELPTAPDARAASALSRLPPADKDRVENFLKVLSLTRRSADTCNIESLLKLIRSLSAPEGPRALMAILQAEQPALFARLHESMLRTQHRLATGDGPHKEVPGPQSSGYPLRIRPTPSLPPNCMD